MKLVDYYAGAPACFLLSTIGKFFSAASPLLRRDASVRKILVIKFWGIGSIVNASPALRALRQAYPAARLTLLTLSRNTSVYDENRELVDRVVHFEVGDFWRFSLAFLRFLLHLASERYDLVVDLEFFSRFSAVVTFLSLAPRRIGFDSRKLWRSDLYSHVIPYRDNQHVIDSFLDAAVAAGAKRGSRELSKPFVSSADRAKASSLLLSAGIHSSDKILVINPNTGELALERRWPLENFSQLIELSSRLPGVRIVLIGAAKDRPIVYKVLSGLSPYAYARSVNTCGRLSLRQLAALFERADAVVSNDSGPMHLSAAVGTPTICLFGPETPAKYGPLDKRHFIFYESLRCSPCMSVANDKTVSCPRNAECMRRIKVAKVFETVKKLLSEPRKEERRTSRAAKTVAEKLKERRRK